jgi:hypothetical protein
MEGGGCIEANVFLCVVCRDGTVHRQFQNYPFSFHQSRELLLHESADMSLMDVIFAKGT